MDQAAEGAAISQRNVDNLRQKQAVDQRQALLCE